MENKDRPSGSLLPEKDTRIQLVVNNQDDEDTIDLGRVFRNMKLKTRIYAWVLVLCMLVGICAPLLLYQFTKPELTVTSVVTLRYDAPNPEYLKAEEEKDEEALKKLEKIAPVARLVTPEGEPLDLSVVTSAPVLQQALSGLTLSKPVTVETLRNNLTVTRVLTEESSRTKEALAGLADSKDREAYIRLEKTELEYQNRFIVSLANGFGDEDDNVKYELTDEELRILLNRVLDEYNATLARQWADVRLPEDGFSVIDPETQDIPEILDSLDTALEDLYAYCEGQPDSVKEYRSWQTGMNLNEWMEAIRTVQDVNVNYLDAYVYTQGLMRDKEAVKLTFRYRLRTLQGDLEKVNARIAANAELLKNYKNNEVYVSMQESDSSRSTQMTTDYYNELVLKQQEAYSEASQLRIRIAETQENLDRLDASSNSADITEAEADLATALENAKTLYASIRAHMSELFSSSLYTTYSEHSEPQGEDVSFLKASWKKMLIGFVAGAVIGCGIWFLAALAPEFLHKRKDDDPEADAKGKEAAEV